MLERRTMLWSTFADILMCAETSQSPSDAEWDELLAALSRLMTTNPRHRIRVLVASAGGGPNALQRKRAVEAGWSNNPSPIAVVIDVVIARGVITAFSWFNVNIKAFPFRNMDLAFGFLQMAPGEIAWATSELPRLRKELGLSPLAS